MALWLPFVFMISSEMPDWRAPWRRWIPGLSPDFLTVRQVSNSWDLQLQHTYRYLQIFNPSFLEYLESRKTLTTLTLESSSPRAYPIINCQDERLGEQGRNIPSCRR